MVESASLVSAGGQVDGIADALADIDVASPFGEVSDGLVGSETSQACLWVSTRLGAAVQVYADRIRHVAGSARGTAELFDTADGAVAQAFGPSR
ncbi:hypothetical protein GON03_10215 [Nocardioides sp. MAH-18]|uniref:ESX-1 secretion-associated protein n=1 Tax=Nocardioides agri TaxID=2682843 RepID=A0A6L6XQG0_9ACTN|nr:hypothetical protein [Nocardioides sp. CGMCC 1.13656]MBA2954698.1 hypothetical protein [Nocardioides sp. CGMCC 1.13656]MVQ49554.1 hypothetical protein [Nocardioides sp. MAH-18]